VQELIVTYGYLLTTIMMYRNLSIHSTFIFLQFSQL